MKIDSRDIPQADTIDSILKVVEAVGAGARTDIEIANMIPAIRGDARQGRYYRRAAQNFGFIVNERNNSRLTEKGKRLLKNPSLNNPLFIDSVLEQEIIQMLVPLLEINKKGLTKREIINYLKQFSSLSENTIDRRLSTITAWLRSLGFIKVQDRKIHLVNNFSSSYPFFRLNHFEQPILPKTGDLREFEKIEENARKAGEIISYYKNLVKQERSNQAHLRLVNMVAERIRNHGAIPKCNQLIDLAVRLDHSYLFEIKSTTNSNIRNQIRRGVSQLYEYRYLQNQPEGNLILVIENPLDAANNWMIDYLENDRGIYLVWDGRDDLFGTSKSKADLPFLSLN